MAMKGGIYSKQPGGKHHLDELEQPIAMRPECLAQERTKLIVGHTKADSGGCWTARTSTGTIITTCSGKMLSNSNRREFNNAAGAPLFVLRRSRFSISQSFWLESPQGQRSVDIKVKWALLQAKLDVSLKNAASDAQEEVKLDVRSADPSSMVTTVSCDGKRVAIIRRKQEPKTNPPKFLPEYDVDVVSGLDLALVSAIVVVLADAIQSRSDTVPKSDTQNKPQPAKGRNTSSMLSY